jgi:hypothetical protein
MAQNLLLLMISQPAVTLPCFSRSLKPTWFHTPMQTAVAALDL